MSENTQKAISRIEQSEHVGIFLPENPDLDAKAACEVLLETLLGEGKIVGVLNYTQRDEEQQTFLPRLSSSPALPREFIISLYSSESPISQLRYEKFDDRVDIVVSPKEKTFKENLVAFREGKTRCSAAILLGVKNVEEVANTPALHPEFFTETPLLNFDVSSENKNYAEANIIKTGASLSELVYEFLTAWRERPLPKTQATLLLAGVLARTGGFRADETSADALLAASELMRAGASLAEARAIQEGTSSFPLVQLFGRATVRSKWDEKKGVLWSFLTAEDFEKTGRAMDDTSRVMEHLHTAFIPHRLSLLLAQHPHDKTVVVTAAGGREALAAIREKTPAEFQSPYLKLDQTFASFRDAEEFLDSLLEDVL